MSTGTGNGVQGIGPSQDLNVCSLMGGGPQAILYSLMNSILALYSEIRAECSKLAQDLVKSQSASVSGSAKMTAKAGEAQELQSIADAAQSFGAAACSFAQLGANMKGLGTKDLAQEHENLSNSVGRQQKLLDMANDPKTFDEPMGEGGVDEESDTASVNSGRCSTISDDDNPHVQANKKRLMEHLGEDDEGRALTDEENRAAIRAMKGHDGDETQLNKFKDDLRASIRHKQTLMTEKTQQMSYVREMINTISQGATNAIGGSMKAWSGVEAKNAGMYNANKTLRDYLAQSAGEGVQTFTESLRHYYDLVAGLVQSTSAAARATPQ